MQALAGPLWAAGDRYEEPLDYLLSPSSPGFPLLPVAVEAAPFESSFTTSQQLPPSPVPSLSSSSSSTEGLSSPFTPSFDPPPLIKEWEEWEAVETGRVAAAAPLPACASDSDQLWSETAQKQPLARSSSARKRPLCQSACVPCRRAKTGCDGQRPCGRCNLRRRGADCVDRTEEDIQRGLLNRKRKPKTRPLSSTAPQPASNAASPPIQQPPALPEHHNVSTLSSPSAAAASALHSTRDYASLVCLAAAQASGVREVLARYAEALSGQPRVEARCRRTALRAIHIGLAHYSDQLDPEDFSAFLQGRPAPPLPPHIAAFMPLTDCASLSSPSPSSAPVAPLPLPAALQGWLHPRTRPMYMEWSCTPSTCLDAESDAGAAVATARIHFLAAASSNLTAWESQQDSNDILSGLRPVTDAAQESPTRRDSSASLESLLSCLSVNEAASGSGSSPSLSRSHATWCSAQQPSRADAELGEALLPDCSCADSLALPCVLVVNAAWQRLFGWSQDEVRRQVLRRGTRALADWYRLDAWYAYHSLLAGQAHSHSASSSDSNSLTLRTFVVCRSKWGTELSCLFHKSSVVRDGLSTSVMRFVPIAHNPHAAQSH